MKNYLLFISLFFTTVFVSAQTDLFFSEYCEGTGNNKGVEIYNPTSESIDLTDYYVVRYANGSSTFTTDGATDLLGTIEPHSTFVLVNGQTESTPTSPACDPEMQALADQLDHEYPAPMYMNGNDAIALVKTPAGVPPTNTNITPVDLIGQVGLGSLISGETGWSYVQDTTLDYLNGNGDPIQGKVINYIVQKYATNGSDFGPFWMSWTSNHTLIRSPEVFDGIVSNPDPFVVTQQWDTLPAQLDPNGNYTYADIWDNLGTHDCIVSPTLSVDFSANDTVICESNTVVFTIDENAYNIDSISWEFPGGTPSSSHDPEPEIEYSTAGEFDVVLVVYENQNFASQTKQNYITVNPVPPAPAPPAGDEMVCYDEVFSNYTTNSTSAIWELSPPSAGTQNYYDSTCQIIWAQNFSGEVSLKVKIYNGCGEGEFSEPLYIQKLESSNAEFSASQTVFVNQPYTVQFTNLTPSPDDFEFFWDFGNGGTSTEVQPEYTYPENGEYSVTLKATNTATACTDSIIKEDYIFCSGVGIAESKDEDFKYWVDYTDKALKIEMPFEYKNSSLKLFDMQGKLCGEAQICQPEISIPLSGLPAGLYQFVIVGGKRKLSGKIVF